MRVVFLDIDGVLNDNFVNNVGEIGLAQILPRCVENFNRIIHNTGARIVLSSSWRQQIYAGWHTVRGFAALLDSHGVRGWLIGCTPAPGKHDRRDEEVLAWIESHKNESPVMDSPLESWVALDDWDDEMTGLGDRFVHCHGGVGLTRENADKAIEILRTPLPGFSNHIAC